QLARQGFMPVGSTPESFAAFIKEQHVSWGQSIRDAGIQPD
ncbi:MAG: tripartite tricarboxylate transporter substrate binding protein, partial [Betaproteobacteria bacterium]|nr:tripartite tricarboxylate transporter substrate binding protein [Betaproteobacteria bacterium]